MTGRTRLPLAVVTAVAFLVSACGGGAVPTGAATLGPAQTDDAGASQPPEATSAPADSPPPEATPTASVDRGVDRPATIHLDISATDTNSDGSYTSSGPARVCGDGEINFTGNARAFNFEFPHSGDYEIVDVTFGAEDLVPGSSTSSFHISVIVHAKIGGEPPATIVDTDHSGNSGTASLSDAGGTLTLTVDGSDDIGQTIHMGATCGPRG